MAGLGILEPLDPNSRSATILGDGGPSALEVAYKRKGMEAEIGKNIAEAEAAKEKNKIEDDKNKIEQNKLFDQLPSTVKLQHSAEYANMYDEGADELAAIIGRNGGIVPIAGPDGAAYRRITQRLKQVASNSEQLDKEVLRQLAIVDANADKFLPGTREKITKHMYDKKWLRSDVFPPSVMEDYFDVNGYLEPLFSKIKADQDATGYVTREGGTDETTTKYILRDDIKSTAVMGAADPLAFAALKRQLQNMSPEMQGKIAKIAKDNGITPEAAAALELGIGLVEFTEKTRNVTAPNEAGAGRADERATASEFVKAVENVNKGVQQGFRRLTEAFPGMTPTQVSTLVSNNPVLKNVFDVDPNTGEYTTKPGFEIVKDLNRLVVGVSPEVKAGPGRVGIPEKPIKVQAAIRAKNGNITVLTATDEDFAAGNFKASPPIPKEDVFQKVVYPALWNGGEYNPVTPAGMQTAMEEMGYGVKTETINQWNKEFVYKDPNASQGAAQPKAKTKAELLKETRQ